MGYGCKGCGGEAEFRVITEVGGINITFYVCRNCREKKKVFSVDFLNKLFTVPAMEGGF